MTRNWQKEQQRFNDMEITRHRIRVDYAPLNVAVAVRCFTPNSPMAQSFTAKTGSYEPNRMLTPTVILPEVTLNATDGSLSSPYGNALLGDMQWLVNGVDITTLVDAASEEAQFKWQGNYEILTVGSMRGALQLSRNVRVSETFSLVFKAKVYDNRLGVTIPIETDPVTLKTTDKAEDGFSLSISEDTLIRYNPFKDKLFLYEYKVAHGQVVASSSAENAAKDENAYLRRIPVSLFQGKELFDSAYTLKLYEMNSFSETELTTTEQDNELVEIAQDHLTLDLRMVTKADYMLKAFVNNVNVAQIEFSVSRIYPDYRIRCTNGTGIAPTDKERYDKAMVDCDGNIVECPESIIKMIWKTDTAALTGVVHNEGAETLYKLETTGIGWDAYNCWIDEYVEPEHKKAHEVALNEDGLIFEDENGDTLIFN